MKILFGRTLFQYLGKTHNSDYILILKIFIYFRPGGKSSIDADAIGIRHNIEQSHKKESISKNGNEEEKPIPKKSITQQLNEHRWGQFDR